MAGVNPQCTLPVSGAVTQCQGDITDLPLAWWTTSTRPGLRRASGDGGMTCDCGEDKKTDRMTVPCFPAPALKIYQEIVVVIRLTLAPGMFYTEQIELGFLMSPPATPVSPPHEVSEVDKLTPKNTAADVRPHGRGERRYQAPLADVTPTTTMLYIHRCRLDRPLSGEASHLERTLSAAVRKATSDTSRPSV